MMDILSNFWEYILNHPAETKEWSEWFPEEMFIYYAIGVGICVIAQILVNCKWVFNIWEDDSSLGDKAMCVLMNIVMLTVALVWHALLVCIVPWVIILGGASIGPMFLGYHCHKHRKKRNAST